jgi:hypothetical protein
VERRGNQTLREDTIGAVLIGNESNGGIPWDNMKIEINVEN